jgi:hypothetical protein
MPDENGDGGELPTNGRGACDVLIVLIQAFRDILNDWRVATALLVVILLLAGKVAGGDLMAGIEGWIRAWRCQP